jgi:hypothetical protein
MLEVERSPEQCMNNHYQNSEEYRKATTTELAGLLGAISQEELDYIALMNYLEELVNETRR